MEEIIFIDEETLTPNELANPMDAYEGDKDGETEE